MKQLLLDMWGAATNWSVRYHGLSKALALIAPLVVIAWGIYDREPPLRIVEPPSPDGFDYPPAAMPGGDVTFDFLVVRDLGHRCSYTMQRYIVDATLAQRVYGPLTSFNAGSARLRQAMSPDRLRVTLPLPDTLPVGHAHLITDIKFTCPRNFLTIFWPIEETWDWPFEVLPRTPLQIRPSTE